MPTRKPSFVPQPDPSNFSRHRRNPIPIDRARGATETARPSPARQKASQLIRTRRGRFVTRKKVFSLAAGSPPKRDYAVIGGQSRSVELSGFKEATKCVFTRVRPRMAFKVHHARIRLSPPSYPFFPPVQRRVSHAQACECRGACMYKQKCQNNRWRDIIKPLMTAVRRAGSRTTARGNYRIK